MATSQNQLSGLERITQTPGFLATLFELAPVALQIYRADGHCLLVNRAFRDLFASEPPPEYNILKDDLLERRGLLERIRAAFNGETVRVPAFWYDPRELRQHGVSKARRVGIETTFFPIRDAAGQVAFVALWFKDVTAELELRSITEALARSEARKSAILEAALDCIIAVDQSGTITEFNPAAEATFGYRRDEILGRPLVELLVSPALRQKHRTAFTAYLETVIGPLLGKRVEMPAFRADGTEFPAELTVVPTRTDGPLTFTAYIRDLTERQLAARALELSEARFKKLADSGIIGMYVCDTVGNVSDANAAFLDLIGYSRDDVEAGRLRWTEITPPEWRPLDAAAKTQLETTGIARPWEKEYLRKDGSRVPVLVGVTMTEPLNCIAFVLDLTEQRRAEEVRARAVALAEQESAGRQRAEAALRELEEQVQQSHRMEAIGGLAGSIAHDFNNILSVILSYGEMGLEQVAALDPLYADLEQIVLAGRRAQSLTHQLLAFSRRQLLKPKLLNLSDLVGEMSTMLRRLIGEDVELSLALMPDPGLVLVDPGQMEQVLLNLAVNARDAMPRGGKLTIETSAVDLDRAYAAEHLDVEPGRYVRLSVSDTGVGMDRTTQARIFEPFFTTKSKGRGTGLGLSTVFGIVKQSGGHVWVYSEPNKGAAFKIYLPRTTASGEVAQPAATTLSTVLGSETILLVEDDDQVRGLASSILRRNGYRVFEAASGGDALLICEQHRGTIDLLLSDVVMPLMSGRQLWERLAPLRPDMRILFMSGYTDDAIVHHGVLSSEFAFIQKPLTPAILLARVRQVLDDGT